MALMVLAFRRNKDNSLVDIPLDAARDGDSTMAGAESARQGFYSAFAGSLGLKFFGQLNCGDLWAEREELVELHAETLLLQQHVPPGELDYWSYRLGNIVNAIERASASQDGVVHIG